MQQKSVSYWATGLVAVSAIFFTGGCTSKPEASDINAAIESELSCPLLEVSDVEKTDGLPNANGMYEVAYTWTMKLKGGEVEAHKLYPEWSNLLLERQYIMRSIRPATSEANKKRLKEIKARLAVIQPCQKDFAYFVLDRLRATAQSRADASEGAVMLPLGMTMQATAPMVKSESGWHFSQTPTYHFNTAEFVDGKEAKISMPRLGIFWGEFVPDERAYSVLAPSEARCTDSGSDKKYGGRWKKCSFETPRTVMYVEHLPLAVNSLMPIVPDVDTIINETMQELATAISAEILNPVDVMVNGIKGKEFSLKMPEGTNKLRIYASDKFVLQVLAESKQADAPDDVEMAKFVRSVVPNAE